MENVNKYVIYPHNENSEIQPNLTPQDKLIYLAIRRYMNKNTMQAFPSYEKLKKDIGAAPQTIKKSVNNLVEEGYLEIKKLKKGILYQFNNKKQFEPFSYNFLDNPNLSFTEKSYIVATQQYMFKENEEGKISYTNQELSDLINMPKSTISKCNRSLEEKGYLEGSSNIVKKFQLRELDQLFVWKFKEQDEKIQKNIDDIAEIQRENRQMKLEIEELKKRLNKNNPEIIL